MSDPVALPRLLVLAPPDGALRLGALSRLAAELGGQVLTGGTAEAAATLLEDAGALWAEGEVDLLGALSFRHDLSRLGVTLRLTAAECAEPGLWERINWANVDTVCFASDHAALMAQQLLPGLARVARTLVVPFGAPPGALHPVERRPRSVAVWLPRGIAEGLPLLIDLCVRLARRDEGWTVHLAGVDRAQTAARVWLDDAIRRAGLEAVVFRHDGVAEADFHVFAGDKEFVLSTATSDHGLPALAAAAATGATPVILAHPAAEGAWPADRLFLTGDGAETLLAAGPEPDAALEVAQIAHPAAEAATIRALLTEPLVRPRQIRTGGPASPLLELPDPLDPAQQALAAAGGCPDPDLMEALGRALGPGSLVVDAGAAAGARSIVLAAVHGVDVIAVEPVPALQETLVANVTLNGLEEHVRVVDAALGARRSDAAAQASGPGQAPADPDVTTLEALLAEETAPLAALLLAVDGAEAGVLAGALPVLLRDLPPVYVHGGAAAEAAARAVLAAAGWTEGRRFRRWLQLEPPPATPAALAPEGEAA